MRASGPEFGTFRSSSLSVGRGMKIQFLKVIIEGFFEK